MLSGEPHVYIILVDLYEIYQNIYIHLEPLSMELICLKFTD